MKPESITKILESGQEVPFFSLLTLMFWLMRYVSVKSSEKKECDAYVETDGALIR